MAGIYIHIPFCKTRCIYCDFYSTTRSELKRAYIDALCDELTTRRDYLKGEPVETIYLGGGTPSQLDAADLDRIFHTLDTVYGLQHTREITLEANPDDLTPHYVQMLRRLPVNRISMGIQTFDDEMLTLLHRRHTAEQARQAVQTCREAGFDNLSIDLIYGLPGETDARWQSDLLQAVALNVNHLSAYHLTYEEGTPLHRLLEANRVQEVDEESSVRFFSTLIDTLQTAGYEHYEISNFCRPGCESRHNSAYWHGVPYMGCGPSAHSFNRTARQWNVSSLSAYLEAYCNHRRDYEEEQLDLTTRYNEYVMTALRTARGLSMPYIATTFGQSYADYCTHLMQPYLKHGQIEPLEQDGYRLSRRGIFVSDGIISDLMQV